DSMGLLRVGPQSAGADPGPACYGLGGTAATVTDACVVLGYYDPAAFLGGAMPLDAGAAREAVSRVGVPLGLNTVETAWGIFAIVCESMAQAARLYLIERGQDPRRFALVGFGGAGPAAAARAAPRRGAGDRRTLRWRIRPPLRPGARRLSGAGIELACACQRTGREGRPAGIIGRRDLARAGGEGTAVDLSARWPVLRGYPRLR